MNRNKNVTRLPTAQKKRVRNPVAVLDGSEGNVEGLNVATTHDIPPDRVLVQSRNAVLSEVVVCGFDANGEFFFMSSKAGGGDVLWLLELAKKKLMDIADR